MPLIFQRIAAFALILACIAQGELMADTPLPSTKDLRAQALATLQATLAREPQFVKVHAAEYLLWSGHPEGVAAAFEAELAAHGNEPKYRVGIWRILAQTAATPAERQPWIERLQAALATPDGPDRVHALESLAKLGTRLGSSAVAGTPAPKGLPESAEAFRRWFEIAAGRESATDRLAELLASDESLSRMLAAYALRALRQPSPAVWKELSSVAQREPADSPARMYLLGAALVLAPDDESAARFKRLLLDAAATGKPLEQVDACVSLAARGTLDDLKPLSMLFASQDPDVRATAAYAILQITRREMPRR